ncbi:hypothetical protein ACFLZ7_04315 [Nanoarchaeota archaeon]
MADDVSRRTVAILLVVAVVVSVIGTWTTMNTTIEVDAGDGNQGQATLNVLGGSQPANVDIETGNTVFRLNKN